MNNTDLGKRLQSYREKGHVTQQEMATICGLSKNYISAIERGVHKCNAYTLICYAERLGVSLDDLVGLSEQTTILPELLQVILTFDSVEQRRLVGILRLMKK